MDVHVNEARSDDLVRGVDYPIRRRVYASRNVRDLITTNGDISTELGIAGAVDNASISED
jgi:hypothetical protein